MTRERDTSPPGDTEETEGSAADEVRRSSDTELNAERDVEPVNTPSGEAGDPDLPLEDSRTDS